MTNKIQRANLDGSNVMDVLTGILGAHGLDVDASGGKLYWSAGKAIRRANLDGSRLEDLVRCLHGAVTLSLDLSGGKVYWAETDNANVSTSRIQRANLDGSNVETLMSGVGFPWGIAVGRLAPNSGDSAMALDLGQVTGPPIIYDLAADWSDTTNPNGPWSYNGSGGVPLAIHRASWAAGLPYPQPSWGDANSDNAVPTWFKAVGLWPAAADMPIGKIVTHGPPEVLGDGVCSSVSWTSPVNGIATISGGAWMGRNQGNSMDWTLRANSLAIANGSLTSADPYSSANPFDFAKSSGGASVLTFPVETGDTIALEVSRSPTSKAADFVGIDLKIVVTPGPEGRFAPSSADSAMADDVGLTKAAVIVGVSIPVDSQSDLCRPKIDGVWSVSAPPYPLNVTRGIGHLINPDESFAPMVVESFLFHEHDFKGQPPVMPAPHTPNPARAVVTYTFDSPAIVDQLEIVQHTNGITKVEGFVGNSVDSLASIGSVFGPDGDVTGESRFAELQLYVFDFDNEMAGRIFQFVICKCSGSTGYSAYRAFPRNADGVRYAAAIANSEVVPTSRHILSEAGIIGLREEFEKVRKAPGYPAMDKERIDLWLNKLEMREWNDRTGAYSTTARLVSLDKDTVELEKEDGTRVKVPRNRLDKIGASVVAMIISLPERIREDAAKFQASGGRLKQ